MKTINKPTNRFTLVNSPTHSVVFKYFRLLSQPFFGEFSPEHTILPTRHYRWLIPFKIVDFNCFSLLHSSVSNNKSYIKCMWCVYISVIFSITFLSIALICVNHKLRDIYTYKIIVLSITRRLFILLGACTFYLCYTNWIFFLWWWHNQFNDWSWQKFHNIQSENCMSPKSVRKSIRLN